MAKKVILSFSADGKEELHLKLKSLCAMAKKNVNDTILELIEKYVKESDNKK